MVQHTKAPIIQAWTHMKIEGEKLLPKLSSEPYNMCHGMHASLPLCHKTTYEIIFN